jgi:hypothetical protein
MECNDPLHLCLKSFFNLILFKITTIILSHVPRTAIRRFFVKFARLVLWELPPSIPLRVTRKPGFTGHCQRFEGKGLVVAREGISTPSTPYLR